MRDILFLKPVFKEMIWGGSRLAEEFNYSVPSDHTGECWAVSAHPNGDCTVDSGPFAGRTLSSLWKENRELFGNVEGEEFPLLVKIIDAREDLSIQVHPDDAYAREHENGSLGKTECWYVLDSKPEGTIIVGHNAKKKAELEKLIKRKKWEELLCTLPVKKGDFFQITPGTIHAIKGGTMLLEIQQSSDITYRLYDYDRLSDGKPRKLHLKQALDVIQYPGRVKQPRRKTVRTLYAQIEELVSCPYYTVEKTELWGEETFAAAEPFLIVSITEGEGKIDGIRVKKGNHFILPSGYGSYTMKGSMQFVTAHI